MSKQIHILNKANGISIILTIIFVYIFILSESFCSEKVRIGHSCQGDAIYLTKKSSNKGHLSWQDAVTQIDQIKKNAPKLETLIKVKRARCNGIVPTSKEHFKNIELAIFLVKKEASSKKMEDLETTIFNSAWRVRTHFIFFILFMFIHCLLYFFEYKKFSVILDEKTSRLHFLFYMTTLVLILISYLILLTSYHHSLVIKNPILSNLVINIILGSFLVSVCAYWVYLIKKLSK